jgi:peptide-methionine (R)-S-oxide reductase
MSKDPALNPTVSVASMSVVDWKAILHPVEFAILRESATERAGTGRYLDEERAGAYHCAGCAQKLYDGAHKFHSGCGWPSFNQEVEPGALETIVDRTHGMVRTEMRCSRCHGHLGHIFDDAPNQPTGKRHCVNGYAVIFVPQGEDAAEVLATYRAAAAATS